MHVALNSLPDVYLLSFIFEHQLLSEGFLLHKFKVLSFCQKKLFLCSPLLVSRACGDVCGVK